MATIRDVARAANFSIATVSRVFNEHPRVSEEARARVWEAADALGYWPNGAARSLTTNRAHAIGVLLPDLHGEFYSEVLRGVDQGARTEGFPVLISSSHASSEEVIQAARSMQGRIDGLIVMSSDTSTREAIDPIAKRFPIVLMNPVDPPASGDSVTVANLEGARTATEHLLRLGHRRIVFVCGPADNGDAEERRRGYHDALRAAGIDADPALDLDGDFTELAGYRAGMAITRIEPRPTAVFAANDNMALGVLSAFRSTGVDLPKDIALIGFDDISMARYLTPSLSTVRIDAYRLGLRSVQLLISSLRSPNDRAARHEVIPATLVVRRSCGSPTTPPCADPSLPDSMPTASPTSAIHPRRNTE